MKVFNKDTNNLNNITPEILFLKSIWKDSNNHVQSLAVFFKRNMITIYKIHNSNLRLGYKELKYVTKGRYNKKYWIISLIKMMMGFNKYIINLLHQYLSCRRDSIQCNVTLKAHHLFQ